MKEDYKMTWEDWMTVRIKVYNILCGLTLISIAFAGIFSYFYLNNEYNIFRSLSVGDMQWTGNEVIDANTARNAGEWNFTVMFFNATIAGGFLAMIIKGMIIMNKKIDIAPSQEKKPRHGKQ